MSIWSRIGKFLGVKPAGKNTASRPVEVPHREVPTREQPRSQPRSRATRPAPSRITTGENQFRVVLVEQGPVMMTITDRREQSIAGAYYNALGHFLRGNVPNSGPGKDDPYWYQHKVESFEGETINGDPLETDTRVLVNMANQLNSTDSPYESWGR